MKKILLIIAFLPSMSFAGTATWFTGGSGTYHINGNGSGSVVIGNSGGSSGPSGPWVHYRTLTISSSNVAGILNNFPVLVSTYDVTLSTASSGGHLSTGYDLVFTTNAPTGTAGSYACSYSLSWDTETIMEVNTSTMNVWVNLPTVTTNTSTAATFYMCYGNAAISSYQGNSTGTWDSNYDAVWHFSSTGTFLNTNDSTSNGYNLLNNLSYPATSTTTYGPGQIGGGAVFNGAAELYQNDSSGVPLGSNPRSFEFWANGTTLTGVQAAFSYGTSGNDNANLFLFSTSNSLAYAGYGDDLTYTYSFGTGTWHHFVGTFDGTNASIYLDGTLVAGPSAKSWHTVAYGNQGFSLGNSVSIVNNWFYDGTLDEVRVSAIARSANWIQTEYNNQSSPNTFVTIGQEN